MSSQVKLLASLALVMAVGWIGGRLSSSQPPQPTVVVQAAEPVAEPVDELAYLKHCASAVIDDMASGATMLSFSPHYNDLFDEYHQLQDDRHLPEDKQAEVHKIFSTVAIAGRQYMERYRAVNDPFKFDREHRDWFAAKAADLHRELGL